MTNKEKLFPSTESMATKSSRKKDSKVDDDNDFDLVAMGSSLWERIILMARFADNDKCHEAAGCETCAKSDKSGSKMSTTGSEFEDIEVNQLNIIKSNYGDVICGPGHDVIDERSDVISEASGGLNVNESKSVCSSSLCNDTLDDVMTDLEEDSEENFDSKLPDDDKLGDFFFNYDLSKQVIEAYNDLTSSVLPFMKNFENESDTGLPHPKRSSNSTASWEAMTYSNMELSIDTNTNDTSGYNSQTTSIVSKSSAAIRQWDDLSPNADAAVLYNGLDDWDIIQSSDVSYYRNSPYSPGALSPNRRSNRPDGFTGGGGTGINGGDNAGMGTGGASSAETRSLLQNPIEETLSRMSRALNMGDKRDHGFRYLVPPLKDIDFRNYLDDEGSLIKPDELRLLVYQIGVEHSLRKVVWKHLLNVYPTKPRLLTGAERYDYMKVKCEEYYQLKKRWQNMDWENKKSVVSSIRKDVLRTDRSHAFFSDIEIDFEKTPTNPHLTSLFDILMTFAMSFPQISYCQGMSDLASPLLLIMQDEAVTYVCFCALMRRLQQNFTVDSRAMHIKFDHLKLLLQYVDKEFFDYLSSSSESNNFELFFCYRWLLLEMKREFALDDALLMLEVMWASIPPDPPESDIKLATESILQFMNNQCNLNNTAAFTSPTGHNSSATSSTQALDSSIVNRLNPLDASNQDLLNWSMEQNVKSEVPTSKSNSNFAHLSSKQPLSDIDQSSSKRSSISFDENVSSGKITPKEESQTENLKSESLQLNGILTPTKVRYPIVGTREPNGNNNVQNLNLEISNNRLAKQSSLDQEASPSESYLHVEGQDPIQGHKLNHALSCPSLDHSVDDPSETSDLGTTDSENNQEDDGIQEPPSSFRVDSRQSPSSSITANGTAANSTEIKALHKTYPMIQKSSALSSSQSSSSLSPGSSELKRARSDLEVSPNGLKKRGSANVFSYEDSSNNAQVSSLSSLTTNSFAAQTKTKLPPPAEFGCGNPFLLFMCVTLIVQQKQKIIGAQMDITDVSGYFYRLVRSHDVHKVLTHARMLFADYLRKQPWLDDSDC